jgi:hypothetical protein
VRTKPGSELLPQSSDGRIVEARVGAQSHGRVGVTKQSSDLDRGHPECERERGAGVAQVVTSDRLPVLAVEAGAVGRVLDGAEDVAAIVHAPLIRAKAVTTLLKCSPDLGSAVFARRGRRVRRRVS